ncbi:mucin-2-like [Pseudorasbora parva]|uniref:mucin-2-like n=1 Tax=Pseudorasbora parva TaxID=51549 RepID=UPI00351E67FB
MWGNFHFKTFDGDFYQFPGMCEYNLVSDCQTHVIRQFSVHVKRTENSNSPKISRVSISINDITVELTEETVMVMGKNGTLPVHVGGVLVEESTIYIMVRSKIGITVMWNREDAVRVYAGNLVYALLINEGHCEDLLKAKDWDPCTQILNPEPYINACINDLCLYQPVDNDNSSLCATLSEYSRQCSHAGKSPPTWRRDDFCAVTCPYNMVHSESGSPCMQTCLHKNTNALCEEHNIDGCFCPPGTVFDEISKMSCIPVEKCQCTHDGIYNPGDVLKKNEEECICEKGKWICMSIPSPGLCAVEEGSHFTTYDGKEFTFHGDCNYVLSERGSERIFYPSSDCPPKT